MARSDWKECQICGYPLKVEYHVITVDSRELEVCKSCKQIYKEKGGEKSFFKGTYRIQEGRPNWLCRGWRRVH
jgi:ribosome-binding protein aMBF1 (putative translation factor)